MTPVAAGSQARTQTASTEPIFRSLFQAGDRTQPISPAVQELWGNSSSQTGRLAVRRKRLKSAPPGRLDLFSDRNGTFSG